MSNETQVFSLSDLHQGSKITGLYFTITVIEGPDFGLIFPLEREQTLVGRKGDEDLPVDIELNDDQASRRHLMLVKKTLLDKTAYITAVDLESKNGTLINGKPIVKNPDSGKKETELYSGDKIQVGNTVLKYEIKDNLEISYQERLYQQVTRDAQTGLWNYNYATQELEKLLAVGTRNNSPFSVLMLSIDFIQTLNETYGRTIGDNVIRATAKTVMAELSDYEIASRHKGNSMLVLLPETDINGATATAERIRQSIENFDFTSVDCPQRVTASIGVAQFPICGRTAEELTKQADQALYRAQQSGRNRVIKAEATQAKQTNWSKIISVALIIILAVAIIAGSSYLYSNIVANRAKPLIFSGTVQFNEVEVGSKVGGRVSEVLVKEGDFVKAGQVLVRFDVSELIADRNILEAEVKQNEAIVQKIQSGSRKEEIAEAAATVRKQLAVLENLRSGPRRQDIGQIKADLNGALSDLSAAEITFNRIHEVYLQGYQSKQVNDEAQTKVDLAKAKVESLREKLSLVEEGNRPEEIKAAEQAYQEALAKEALLQAGNRSEDIAIAQAQLQSSIAKLEKLEVQIAEREVKSPSDCRIYVMDIRPGDILAPNKPVAKLLEPEQRWVRVYVPQTELGHIKVGQKGKISVDAFENKKFSGYIEEISPEAEFYPRNVQTRTDREHQVFAVKVHIDDNTGELKSGMSADVEFTNN